MRTILNSLLAVVFASSALLASDFQTLQAYKALDIPPAATAYQLPVPRLVAGTFPAGVPAVLFTEETNIIPVLAQSINNTQATLDIALYNLQLGDLSKAIVAARDRKVKVRVIVDYSHVIPKAGPEIQYLIANGIDFKVLKGLGTMGSMHNKYAIFDGRLLQTGSANWSNSAQTTNFENMMFFTDPGLIGGYQDNFEWTWKQAKTMDAPDAQGPPAGKIPADPKPSVAFNSAVFPMYIFSPRGGTQEQIVKAVDAARTTIDIAMFNFASKPIVTAVINAKKRGVQVRIIHNASSSFPFADLVKDNKIDLRYSTGRTIKGLLHDKYGVIDGKLLITGSFNWSNNAENSNYENIIFTTDKTYLNPFITEFTKLYNQATIQCPVIPQ